MQDIENIISNIGFPILITLIMFYFIENITEKYLSSINENMAKLDDSIQELTLLVAKIEGIQNENKKEAVQSLSDNEQTK